MRQFVRIGAVMILVLITACGAGTNQAAPAASRSADPSTNPADGDAELGPAKDFTLRTFDGGTFTLSDHFGELPFVLNFWAPW